jgi:hypothetical protein
MRLKSLLLATAATALAAASSAIAQGPTTTTPTFSKIEASGVVLTQVSTHTVGSFSSSALYAGAGKVTVTDAAGATKTIVGPVILTVDTIKDAKGLGIVNGSLVVRDKVTGATLETRVAALAGDTSDISALAEGALRTPATAARPHPPLWQVRAILNGKAGTTATKTTMTVDLDGVVF